MRLLLIVPTFPYSPIPLYPYIALSNPNSQLPLHLPAQLHNCTDQTGGLEANRHKVKVYNPSSQEESAGSMFLMVMEAMVYTVGAIFVAAGLYVAHRWYKGESVPFVNAFNSELTEREFEMRAQTRMPVTPDEFRT
jgi:hypothetical protein